MKKKSNINSKDMRKKLLSVSVILMLVIAVLGGYTLSKYLNFYKSDNYIGRPDSFYFESDYLTVNRTEHTMANWNTDKDYSFIIDIRNFQDTLKSSKMDIEYSLNVTGLEDGTVKAALNDIVVTNGTKYTLAAGSPVTDRLVITIPKNRVPAGNQITVTATTTPELSGGYSKTIAGVFNLVKNSTTFELDLEYHREYYDLLVGVAKDAQTITVTWPSSLVPDTTIKELKDADNTTKTATYKTTKEDESARLRFFVTGNVSDTDTFIISDAEGNSETVKIRDAY